MTAGFRESGISSLPDTKGELSNIVVAVRSSGLGLDSIIGFHTDDVGGHRVIPMVSEPYLHTLFHVANQRFVVNSHRTERFREALMEPTTKDYVHSDDTATKDPSGYEPAAERRERLRKQGLQRQAAMHSGTLTINDTTCHQNGGGEQIIDQDGMYLDILEIGAEAD